MFFIFHRKFTFALPKQKDPNHHKCKKMFDVYLGCVCVCVCGDWRERERSTSSDMHRHANCLYFLREEMHEMH